MEKLKPCPFCGGEPEILEISYYTYVKCMNAKCAINPITPGYLDADRTVHEWNKREDGKNGEQNGKEG